MNNRRMTIGYRIQRKQFRSAHERGGINWVALLFRPLNLYSVRRISDTYAIGIVKDWNMTQRFHVNLFPDDIAMLEAAQDIQLAIGDVWKPDNKYGYIECEVRQYKAFSDTNGYFNGFKYVEPATYEEITHYGKPERVYYNHEDYWLTASTASTVTLVSVEFDEEIMVSRADYERAEDVLGLLSVPLDNQDKKASAA